MPSTMGRGNKKRGNAKKQESFRVVDEVDDSDDEEIDEDEAFNSDDERKYGAFFEQRGSDEEDEELDSDEDDEEEGESDEDSQDGDGGQYMLDLLDRLDDKKETQKEEKNGNALGSHVKESPFAASVLPAGNLTLDTLMDGLKDTKGFGTMAKSLKKVATGKATAAPLDKVKADRVERKLHYDEQTKSISHWTDAVQENRKAETLDFRPKQIVEATQAVMIDSFVPTTDFEKQLQAALDEAGQKDEKAILEAEEKAITDDLCNNVITMEEYQKRRGQLAKMRALMLYHEQKRHHINKIKSKKYRRIRKRQREKAKESELADAAEENPDIVRELEEKEEIDRMKERMTLAHKNTSKWAKRILKRGKNVDADTRRALSAQLKKGDDLLKRMKSRINGEEDDDSGEEDLIESARKVLEETEQDDEAPASGLFKLAFMQRGVDKQRQRAKAEARQLLEELEEDVEGSDSDGDKEEEESPAKKIKVASATEMKEVMNKGNLVASSLTFGNSTSLAMSGDLSLDVNASSAPATESNLREHSGVMSAHEAETPEPKSKGKSKPKGKHSEKENSDEKMGGKTSETKAVTSTSQNGSKMKETTTSAKDDEMEEEQNPWLAAAEASSGIANKKKKSKHQTTVDVELAAEVLVETKPKGNDSQDKEVPSSLDGKPKQIAQLTQDELVRRAFAGINDQEEFDQEKKRVQDEEEGVLDAQKKKKKGPDPSTVSGWGSWTGLGAPPPLPKKRTLPKHLQAPKKRPDTKRARKDAAKPAVIIREGRLGKMANTYMLQKVPYPYKSREEYERSMMGGIGPEWNMAVKEMTQPDVVTRPGKIIQPLSMQAKKRRVARPAAKF